VSLEQPSIDTTGHLSASREAPKLDHVAVDRYLTQLQSHLLEVFEQVEKHQEMKLEKTKWLYDRNIKPITYNEGDLVLKNVVTVKTGLSKKLAKKWEGPYVVVKRLSEQNYQVKSAKNPKARTTVVHHNRLKKFFGELDRYPEGRESPEPVPIRQKDRRARTRNATASGPNTDEPTALNPPNKEPNQPPSKNITDLGPRIRKPVDRLTYH
jgi:hypothetical protein